MYFLIVERCVYVHIFQHELEEPQQIILLYKTHSHFVSSEPLDFIVMCLPLIVVRYIHNDLKMKNIRLYGSNDTSSTMWRKTLPINIVGIDDTLLSAWMCENCPNSFR